MKRNIAIPSLILFASLSGTLLPADAAAHPLAREARHMAVGHHVTRHNADHHHGHERHPHRDSYHGDHSGRVVRHMPPPPRPGHALPPQLRIEIVL